MPELTPIETDTHGLNWYAEPPTTDGLCPQCGSRLQMEHTHDRAYVGAVPANARCFDCDYRWSE